MALAAVARHFAAAGAAMAEIEVHPAHEHDADPLARRTGMMVGVIGITLAVVTIAAHREHTAAVIHRTEANDQWAYY
jgi:ammonia channel protein AmtB